MSNALDATMKNLTAARNRDGNAAQCTVTRCRKALMAGGSLSPEQTEELAAAMDLLGTDAAAFADEIRTHLARVAEYRELREKVALHTDASWGAAYQAATASAVDLDRRAAEARVKATEITGDARAWADLKSKAESLARKHPEVAK